MSEELFRELLSLVQRWRDEYDPYETSTLNLDRCADELSAILERQHEKNKGPFVPPVRFTRE